jgi:hypothetical protein
MYTCICIYIERQRWRRYILNIIYVLQIYFLYAKYISVLYTGHGECQMWQRWREHAHARARACVCVCARARVCVCVCVCVRARALR